MLPRILGGWHPKTIHHPRHPPPQVIELEAHLRHRFGTSVSIKVKATGRGQIVIDFNTQEEFERVMGMIRG
jgi:ParB family chromosome partitioning protein